MSLANRPVESRPTERRRGAKLGLARTLSNKWLALLVVAGAALAIAFGYCLIAIQSVEISSMAAAVSFAAFEASLLFSYAIYQSQKIALVDLQKDLRPQIKVLGLRKRVNSVNNERSFDLIVRNDGAEAIENCSAVVSSIRIVRYSKPRGEQTLDVSSLYAQELPLALAVPAGPDLILSD